MRFRSGWILTAALLLSAGAPLRAQGVEEAGIPADKLPWSGWWWPARTGSLVLGYRGQLGPLVKLDQLTGQGATFWEQRSAYHYSLDAAEWWGHCHAWAAAALLEREPLHDVYFNGMPFFVGDIKGLLSEAHYQDRALFYGQRYNGRPGDDFQDMSPLLVWSVLRKYIHDNQTAVVFDLNPGPQVWSYPCYRYRISYQPGGSGSYVGQLSLWVASFQVYPDTIGTQPEERDYTFAFQAQGDQLLTGTDRWLGQSLQDHPDFAWYPTERVQENPGLDYNLVTQLEARSR